MSGAEAGQPAAQQDGGAASYSGGTLPPVTSVFDMGPFMVTIDMNAGPNSGGWVAHPTTLGQNGLKHPIFTWGCGGGSQPSQYQDHLNFIASHGFVVEAHVSTGDGTDSKAAVDWLIAQNSDSTSQYYQKLDITKIAAGGHSEGSITTYAFEATDMRLTTTIHVAGGSFDGNGYMDLHTPVCFIDGDQDTLALANTQTDYMKATVPAFLTVMTGVDHIYAAREGLPVIVGWLRWHLGGETQRKSMFVGSNCDFCNGMYTTTSPPQSGGAFQSQSKNW